MVTARTMGVAAAGILALAVLPATRAHATMRKCVGPGGEVRFTNQECPEGFTLEASRPASTPSAGGETDEPYICKFSSILASTEIVSALAEAEGSLAEAKAKGDADSTRYWSNCLEQIRLRQTALQTPTQPLADEGAPAECADGTFDYREGGIYFSNSTRYPCSRLRATCTFEVRESQRVTTTGRGVVRDRRREGYTTTTGQRVLQFSYSEKIGKFGTARIGDVSLSGRVTGWNCRLGR